MDLAGGAAGHIDGVGDQARVIAHQGDAGGVHGDVGATAHGETDGSRGQRRSVVDAVADHADGAVGGKFAHHVGLVGGKYFRAHVGRGHAQRRGDGAGGAGVVARHHDRADALRLEQGNRFGGFRARRVTEGQQADQAQ